MIPDSYALFCWSVQQLYCNTQCFQVKELDNSHQNNTATEVYCCLMLCAVDIANTD